MFTRKVVGGLAFEKEGSELRVYPAIFQSYFGSASAGSPRAEIMCVPVSPCIVEVHGFGTYGPFPYEMAASVVRELFDLTSPATLTWFRAPNDNHMYVFPGECGTYEDALKQGKRRAIIIDIDDGSWMVQVNGFTTTQHPDIKSALAYVRRKFQLRAESLR